MQNTRSKNDALTEPSRLARWSVALAATLLLVQPALGAQRPPRPAPRPAAAPVVVRVPQQAPVPPEVPEPAIAPEAEDAPEAPEPPEPADFDFDFDFDNDFELGMQGLSDFYNVAPVMQANMPYLQHLDAQRWAADAAAWQSRERFDNVENEKDPARKAYLQGRNFVSDSEWAKAAVKFNEVVSKYPSSRVVDVALYWYAYSLKKDGNYNDAWNAADRLRRDFPKSRWAGEAGKLQAEIAPIIGKTVDPAVAQANDEEMKIYALFSIMQSDPAKGIPIVAEILKPGSTASQRVKQQAVILLAQVDEPRAIDLLINVARSETDQKVRRQAIIMLGQRLDDKQKGGEIFNLLKQLTASNDSDIAKMAVVAIAQDDDQRSTQALVEAVTSAPLKEVRKQALVHLAQRNDAAACDALIRVYDNTKEDEELRRFAIVMLAQSDCPQATDKLMQVIRAAESVELRRFALIHLAQKDPAKAGQVLVQMYDSEKNETIREGIIDGLGQIVDETSNKDCLRKLMSIAKTDPSIQMRKKAIYWIGQSKDPEATQFLVDLLK